MKKMMERQVSRPTPKEEKCRDIKDLQMLFSTPSDECGNASGAGEMLQEIEGVLRFRRLEKTP